MGVASAACDGTSRRAGSIVPVFEEVVIWGRNRELVTGEPLLEELRRRGFEPQIVGEIDPPPKNGGSWVLKDKRDRARREDDGVWISWTRHRAGEGRHQFPTRYVIETFDGRSGYDWFLSCAVASVIASFSRGQVSVDGGPDREHDAFVAELAKDPATRFHGPESVVDWESQNLDADLDEDEGEDDDDYEASAGEEEEDEGESVEGEDADDEDYESGEEDEEAGEEDEEESDLDEDDDDEDYESSDDEDE